MLRLVGGALLLLAAIAKAEEAVVEEAAAEAVEEVDPELIELEEGVLVLTDGNFKKALADNDHILVEFYAPWCGHCKKLEPEYASAAKTMAAAGSAAKLAKVDATRWVGLAKAHGAKGYPTLKFFKRGVASDYTGGRTADEIVSWMEKKTGPPAVELVGIEATNEFLLKEQATMVGFFKDQECEEAKTFIAAADLMDEYQFGITSDPAVFDHYKVAGDKKLVLFKKFDEQRNDFEGEITEENVKDFLTSYGLPLVVDFHAKTAKKIFGSDIKGHFIFFSSANDEEFQNRLEMLRNVAKDYRGKMMFVSVTTDESDHQRVLDFFGIWETPTYRIANIADENGKYKPASNDFTEAGVRQFVEAYHNGELTPDLKTQEVPEDWDALPVKVLVGKNFEEVALDENKDVLVEFYAPWCGHCKKLAPIYDELGEFFKDVDDVVIAKMDATMNEVNGVKAKGYPTIKLFKKGNEVADYTGDRTLNSFIGFLRPDMVPAAPEESDEGEVKEGDAEKPKAVNKNGDASKDEL